MNSETFRRSVFLVTVLVTVVVSGCGTFEIGMEPAATIAEPAATVADPAASLTATPQPAPTNEEVNAAPSPVATTSGEDVAPTTELSPTPTEAPAEAEDQSESVQPLARPSETTMLDETWFNYTNYELGFSINFPRTKIHFMGSCKWNEENGDHSYRPEPSHVPVSIFEDVDTVYITSEYRHELGGETRETSADGGTRIFFSECLAVPNSLELLRDPEYYQEKWEIVARDVHDDEELDAFLKARYGSGCSLGEKVASGQEGVYDVTIQGDGKHFSESQCPLNYGTVVKYYPEGNKVIAWDTGQSYHFSADVNNLVTYDQEMIDSFRFLTGTSDGTALDSVEYDYAGWQSYANEALGYSLMYPGNAEVISPDPILRVDFVGPLVDDKPWPMFTVEHYDDNLPEGADFRQSLIDGYRASLEANDLTDEGMIEEVAIGGVPAIRLSFRFLESSEADDRDDYHFRRGDEMFRVSITHVGGLKDWVLYDQFLQSISFEPD